MSKQTIFKDVLENKYQHEDFVLFTKEFLSGMKIVAPDSPQSPPAHFAEYVKEYFLIGNYRGGRDKIIVLAVNLNKNKSVDRAR